ncbi:MAG: DNA internalization-related competence protein ComEC/Rec2 [Thiolinea sp.]
MRILSPGFSLSFFAGTLVLFSFSRLPPIENALLAIGLILMISIACTIRAHYRLVGAGLFLALGFCWAFWHASQLSGARIPPSLEGKDILVQGVIQDIPVYQEKGVRFILETREAYVAETKQAVTLQGKIRIGWYRHFPENIKAGEQWQLRIRAKQPSGFMNPGGFDYEKWLFSQRIIATGYVRKSAENRLLTGSQPGNINLIRQQVLTAIQDQLGTVPMQGIVAALAVAWRHDISPEQWEVLRRTGTSHLVAISGLHIGLVAGFDIFLTGMIWWLFPRLYLTMPVNIAGAVLGVLLAIVYALLAGLTLPTQRALVMVLVIMLGLLLRRTIPFTQTLGLALLAVLLLDPLAALSAGFWLSFLSVLMIFLLSQRSIQRRSKSLIILIQLGLSLGMIPLTASLFGSVSLMSAPANLIAVPLVSLLVVPLVLAGVVLLPVSQWLAGECWQLAAWVLQALFTVLEFLAGFSWSALQLPQTPLIWVLIAMAGFVLLIMPKGMPGRWLGLILLLPVFFWQPQRPEAGAFRLTMLDVGQGLAAVIETQRHVLVYDAGPKSNDGFDIGRLVVLPWLYSHGYQQVNTLLVSHADNDHSGGATAILDTLPVRQLLSGAEGLLWAYKPQPCQAGQQWRWDGVTFTVLHPDTTYSHKKRNNRSCVLKVTNQQHSLLLPGDIERPAEFALSKSLKGQLKADVLVVPHHGSKSSSSPAFLKRVEPELALVTAGYRNRFHHPHPSVRKRYQQWGIKLLNTAESGAVRVDFPQNDGKVLIQKYREKHRHYWNR